jgi:SAM-dependent methyltransferase
MAAAKRISTHYEGAAGAAYRCSQQRAIPAFRARLKRDKILSYLPPGERIIDFGCGGGALLSLLPYRERIGVDAISQNRDEARQRGLDARESLADIPDGWADAAISNHSLEHTLHPLSELREIRRALRPGGTVVVCVPADDWRNQRVYRPDDRDHHLYAWTPLSLGHLLAEAGFTVKLCRVDRRALPGRATPLVANLPDRVLRCVMAAVALVLRRGEILAVAQRPTG